MEEWMELVGSMLSKPSNSNNFNSNKWCSSRRLNLVHRTLVLLEMSQTASISPLATPSQGKILLHLPLYTSNSIIWTMGLHNFPMRTPNHLFRNNSSHRWHLIKWAGNNNISSNSSSSNNLLLLEATLLLPLVAILKTIPHKTLLKLLHLAHLTLGWWMMRLSELLKSRMDYSFVMSLALR